MSRIPYGPWRISRSGNGHKGFSRNRDGNIALLFALLALPLCIAAGIAIDLQRAGDARLTVQEAADSALLRAARIRAAKPNANEAELTALARRIFDAATPNLKMTISKFAIVFDPVNETFTLDIEGEMDTAILGIAHIYKSPIDTVSQVRLGEQPPIEIVMALDNTGSMNQHGKLSDLKHSASELVEAMFAAPDADVKVGLVPFAQYVNVGSAYKDEYWIAPLAVSWSGCVGSRSYPDNLTDADYVTKPVPGLNGAPCPDPLLPLTDDKDAILDAVNGMDGSGWTYIPAGLVWAWRVISPAEPFTNGRPIEEIEAANGVKAIIVLTDGENTRAPTYPLHDSANQSLANELMIRICDNIKAEKITIYSIAFDVTDATIRDLMEQCATTPGHYFDPESDDELANTFASIASSLRSLSLSK